MAHNESSGTFINEGDLPYVNHPLPHSSLQEDDLPYVNRPHCPSYNSIDKSILPVNLQVGTGGGTPPVVRLLDHLVTNVTFSLNVTSGSLIESRELSHKINQLYDEMSYFVWGFDHD